AQGTPEFRTTIHHKYPVFAMPRTCLCGCGTAVQAGSSYISTHPIEDGKGSIAVDWVGYNDGTDRWNIRFPSEYNPYQKLEAQNIKPGDYLMLPRKFEVCETNDTPE